MSDLKVALRILAQDAGFSATLKAAIAGLDQAGDAAQSLGSRAEAGSSRARKGIESISAQLDRAKTQLLQFVGGFATLQGLRSLAATADAAANLQGKLKLVTDGQQELTAATEATFRIAQQTNASWGETVTLYQRMAQATGDSAEGVSTLTKAVNDSLTASSAGAAEAASTMTQLGQALASGVLRGEEFNAMAENAPRLMTALSDALGKTRGELRKLAEEGALTSNVVATAIKEQASAIADDAAQMPLTLGRAVQQFSNEFTRFIGDVDAAYEITSTLAGVIVELSGDMDVLTKAVAGAAVGFGVLYTQSKIAAAGWLTASTALTSLSGMLTVIGTAALSFQVGSVLADQFQIVRDAGAYLVIGLNASWDFIRNSTIVTAEAMRLAFLASIDAIQEGVANLLDGFVQLANFDLPLGLRADFTYGSGEALQAYAQTLRNNIDLNAEVSASTANLSREILESTKAHRDLKEGVLDASAAYFNLDEATNTATASTKDQGEASTKTAIQLLEEALAAAKASGSKAEAAKLERKLLKERAAAYAEWERQVSDALGAFAETQEQAKQDATEATQTLLDIERELSEYLGGPAVQANNEYTAAIDAIDAAMQALATQAPLTAEQLKQADELKAQALQRYKQEMQDMDPIAKAAEESARRWQQYWGSAMGDVADRFGDFIASGAKSFSDFGRQLKDIAKRIIGDLISTFIKNKIIVPITAQITGQGPAGGITSALGSLFGGSSGGGLGSLFGIGNSLGSLFGLGSGAGVVSVTGGAGGLAGLLGNFGTQVAGSAGAGAGLMGSLGAAMPYIGAVLAVGSILKDAFTYKPTGQSGTSLSFSDAGVSGSNTTQVRRSGLFGLGRRTKDRTSALTADQLSAGSEISEAAAEAGRQAARLVGAAFSGTVPAEFSRTVKKDGTVTEIGTILGATYRVPLEEFARVIAAESAIKQLPAVASELAQRFRGSVDTIVDASQFLVAAQAAINQGAGLFEGDDALSRSLAIVESLQDESESLVSAYARVVASTALLDQALELSGISTDLAREAYITFAAGIAEAAGGIEQAASLWQRYFDVAYTEQERGTAALLAAQRARDAALADAGLAPDATIGQIRAAIDELLRTGGDPERITALLIAADAIADVDEATSELADAAERAAAALTAAIDDLDAFSTDLDQRFQDLARSGMTEFEQRMLSINDQLQSDVEQLQRVRAEMVRRGATTEQLARIDRELGRAHAFAAQQAAAAIAALREQGRGLVAQFRGISQLVRDAAQNIADAGTQAFEQIGQAAGNVYEAQLSALQSIQQWLDDQLLGDASSLTPAERMAEAQRQFNAALAAAQGGDEDALRRVTQLADLLLREGRGFDPSTFPALEASIRAALQSLVAAGPTATRPPVGDPGFAGNGGPGVGIGGEIAAAGDEFSASQAELALSISEIIRQLISATGDSLGEVAASIGIEISELVDALGISLTDVTAASTQQLAELASTLGVELSELASDVGVELGTLADRQSLLNDAVEAEIAALPDAQRARLQPLLDAVEAAADDPVGLARAEAALVDEIGSIGGAAADALAPYFDDIDPIDPLLSIDATLRAGFTDVVEALRSLNLAQPEGSFAVGTPYVERDMLAQIHRGEAVIDAQSMSALRRYGIPVASTSGSSDAMVLEIRALRTELAELRRTTQTGDQANVQATLEAARKQADAIDRARYAHQGRMVMSP